MTTTATVPALDDDLLALAHATGTVTVIDTTPRTPQVGDTIINIKQRRGTTDVTVVHGRITRITKTNRAWDHDAYLGRIDGTLGWTTRIVPDTTRIPKIGDYIHNSRPTSINEPFVVTGRIAHIDRHGAAYTDTNTYLGRINGTRDWTCTIHEPPVIETPPTSHNALIIITHMHGKRCNIPAVYNTLVHGYQLLTPGTRATIDGSHWVSTEEITSFIHAQVTPR